MPDTGVLTSIALHRDRLGDDVGACVRGRCAGPHRRHAQRAARRAASSPAATSRGRSRELLGDWQTLDVPRFAAGMIGSRQGWVEAPYVACPAAFDALAAQLVWTPGRELAIVPGLISRDGERRARRDARRGDAARRRVRPTADGALLAVLPGTHSKWAQVERGRVVAFQTHMTGELYAVLLANSILGRLATPATASARARRGFRARCRSRTGGRRTRARDLRRAHACVDRRARRGGRAGLAVRRA